MVKGEGGRERRNGSYNAKRNKRVEVKTKRERKVERETAMRGRRRKIDGEKEEKWL